MRYPANHLRRYLLLLLCFLAAPGWAKPERLALVIGNSDYQQIKRLNNPANDAKAVAARLSELGFTLVGQMVKTAKVRY